jgi:polysaccharide biosynthesis protein PslH
MLTPYLPYPLMTGGQTRSYNLIKRLSLLGHEITLFSFIKKDEERKNIKELEKICKQVKVFKRPEKPWTLKNILKTGFSKYPFLVIRNWAVGEKQAVEEILKNEKFDLIHAETFYVMPHIPKIDIPIVLVDQTIEFLVYQHYVKNYRFAFLKPFLYSDVAKLKYWELSYWRKASKVIAMSDADKSLMQQEIPGLDVEVVPNGVDSKFFAQTVTKREKDPTILYLGNFTWLQNREAVKVLIKQVWPKVKKEIRDAKLWIIGKDAKDFFSSLISGDIRVDEVEDVRTAYQGAWVLVTPILSGGGTRLKNFETFASGLPVVTTSIGIGGTEAENGQEVIVEDDPEEMAKATIQLINNPEKYKDIAKKAKKMVQQKYDWDPISQKLNDIYEEVVFNQTKKNAEF